MNTISNIKNIKYIILITTIIVVFPLSIFYYLFIVPPVGRTPV